MPRSPTVGSIHPKPSSTRRLVSTPGPARLYPTPTSTPPIITTAPQAATPGLASLQLPPSPSVITTPMTPIPSVAPAPPPELSRTLPSLSYRESSGCLNGDPTKHGSWSPRWQKFLVHARTFALSDLIFSHGFPTAYVLRNRAGEALTHAWTNFSRKNPLGFLDKDVCESASPLPQSRYD
jgi:hypothetical protein